MRPGRGVNAPSIDVRFRDDDKRNAFGFVYVAGGGRVGFSTSEDGARLQLWASNYGPPTAAEVRRVTTALAEFAEALPWKPEVEWRVD